MIRLSFSFACCSVAKQSNYTVTWWISMSKLFYIDNGELCGRLMWKLTNSTLWPIIFTNANIVLPYILIDHFLYCDPSLWECMYVRNDISMNLLHNFPPKFQQNVVKPPWYNGTNEILFPNTYHWEYDKNISRYHV